MTAELRAAGRATTCEEFAADATGSFRLKRAMTPWSVVLVRET